MARRVVAVVLAAGRATRFGSTKVLAPLGDRPILQHVLDRLTPEVAETIVVLGDDAAAIDAAIDWPTGVRRVLNPDPSRGLGSSLVIGVAAARDAVPELPAVLVALGDQPHIEAAVVRELIAMLDDPRPVKVPRYSDGANPNPVVIAPAALDLVEEVSGDRGLGPVIARHPELVHELAVTGRNPDIDTPADLETLRRTAGETHPTVLRHPVS